MGTDGIATQLISELTTPKEDTSQSSEGFTSQDTGGDSDLAKRLSILSRKEKGILDEKKSIEQMRRELEEKSQKLSKWQKFEELNDDNIVDFLREKGASLEKVQEKWLSQLGDEDLDPIQKQIKELRTQLQSKDEEIKKILNETLGERDKQEKQRKLDEQSRYYNAELEKFIAENTEKYDLINTFGAKDEVFQVIKDVYLKTSESGNPKLLTFDEACELYEKKLDDVVMGLSKSKKVKKLLGMESEEDTIANLLGQKTIDDSFSQSSATSPELKTEAERLKAAAKLFEMQMKGA
jgi:exonuclease VII large subunit